MMITAGRFVFFEIRSYPSEGFSNRPNPSSKILTSGDGAISLPDQSWVRTKLCQTQERPEPRLIPVRFRSKDESKTMTLELWGRL